MKLKPPISWYDVKDSLWYRPAVMTIAAILLSFVTIQIDHELFAERRITLPFVFAGGVEGARGVLSAIASTMITVATTAFSVTLVALQLGSSKFSPRILRSFTGDRGNQMVLGIFIATFAFSLSALRTVRSKTEDIDAFVPTISVTVAVLLAFVAIGSLIFFFHHATRTIQASVVIDRTFEDNKKLIQKHRNRFQQPDVRLLQQPLELHTSQRLIAEITCDHAGYVQDINLLSALKMATEFEVRLAILPQPGDYLNPGTVLASVWKESLEDDLPKIDDLSQRVNDLFETGLERTLEQDILFAVQQLADIASLALSPGTNDPTTAISVLDRLGTVILMVGEVSGVQAAMSDEDGTLRVLYTVPTFEEYVRSPLDQIRYYGASTPTVAAHIVGTLGSIVQQLDVDKQQILRTIANEVIATSQTASWVESDRQQLQHKAAWIDELQTDHSGYESATILP